jgi:hypothetical protein
MSGHAGLTRHRRRAALAVLAACAVLGLTACGALPPEAPVPAASVISRALTTIAASCGESYRLQEFTPHPDLGGLEASAAASARKLERIRARHPAWVYQGETLTQIAGASIAYLNGCALSRAASILRVR